MRSLRRLAFLGILLAAGLACGVSRNPEPLVGSGQATEWPGVVQCPQERPQLCTRDYRPVCGRHQDGTRQTYANGCEACARFEVVDHRAGKCPAPGERPPPIRP